MLLPLFFNNLLLSDHLFSNTKVKGHEVPKLKGCNCTSAAFLGLSSSHVLAKFCSSLVANFHNTVWERLPFEMPFLCHSSHISSTGLPWGSLSRNFMALFWVTAAKEFSICQSLIGGRRPNKRLGSHPLYFLSHDASLSTKDGDSSPPLPACLPHPLQECQPKWVALPQNSISKQEQIMDSWLQLTEAEFSTRHTFNPRGWCHWILLDKTRPGESCQSKEQRCVCSEQEWRDAVLRALTTLVSVPVCSPAPQEVLADTEGLQDTHPARAELQTCSSVLVTAPNAAAALTFQRGSVILQRPTCPFLDEWNITRMPTAYIAPQKVFQWNLWWWVNTLSSFYGWEKEGGESCSGLITSEMNAGLLIPIPLTLENPRSIKSSPNHRAVLHSICFQSCLKNSRSYLVSELCCIFPISTVPHQEKPIEKIHIGA